MDDKNKFYVYEWYNIDTNEVFYIGKGCGKRYKEIKKRNQKFLDYIKNNKVNVRLVKQDLTEEEAFALEKELSITYKEKGECSCNLAPCGIGGCHFVWTDEMRQYWSENNPMKKPKQRQRMRENNPMKNKEIALKNGAKHKKRVEIDGVEYDSLKQASEIYKVSAVTIGNWCRLGKSPRGFKCKYLEKC